ncbi:tyrosine-type recombinase/integrase [Streptomyces pseudovenezuelae]|uniref:Tyr recombinase domain-containing protein n=1 Tax=Streptomyces pseudovenezuelae TaxID=67350 RepID=A0ABT6LZS9_9ACTN|nr:tyrosine-type recombinase/integrase [Streptomyces pseudovenezuelae]MDH6221810.1 hypothetical protein [Streptomyces pseudovenezuelae]
MREWVAAIPLLLSDDLDEQGNRLPFVRSLIFPYALRHAYAQCHADAGVPIDVLEEFMDHRSVVTTMSYYQVSLKRKREAISTMRKHTIDRSGHPAPFTSTTDYEASRSPSRSATAASPRQGRDTGVAEGVAAAHLQITDGQFVQSPVLLARPARESVQCQVGAGGQAGSGDPHRERQVPAQFCDVPR